jgi:peptidoglycan/LPS O-acetylase OafA/YrhL
VAKVPTGWADMAGWISLVRFSAVEAPLPVAWSLFHEVLFYLLFLVLILNRRVGIAAFLAWGVLCLAMFHHIDAGPPTPLSAYTALCNLWFFFGMGAYLLFKRMVSGVWAAVAGAGVLAVSGLLDLDHVLWPFLLVTGLALLVAGVARMEAAHRLRCPAWLAFVGNASYTIYLLHESLSGALLKVAARTGATAQLSGEAIFLLVLAGTIALGCVAYVAIEKPLLRLLSRRATGRAGPSTSGAGPVRWTGARRT